MPKPFVSGDSVRLIRICSIYLLKLAPFLSYIKLVILNTGHPLELVCNQDIGIVLKAPHGILVASNIEHY